MSRIIISGQTKTKLIGTRSPCRQANKFGFRFGVVKLIMLVLMIDRGIWSRKRILNSNRENYE